ncbi:MAG: hypothetical protein K6G54_03620, partial [Oscillospiraceae bacterium]|nr:hypothetical protein [Oscillospiraceae bacterium]
MKKLKDSLLIFCGKQIIISDTYWDSIDSRLFRPIHAGCLKTVQLEKGEIAMKRQRQLLSIRTYLLAMVLALCIGGGLAHAADPGVTPVAGATIDYSMDELV